MKDIFSTIKLKLITLVFVLFIGSLSVSFAQNTIEISGSCLTETVVLTEVSLNDEKMYYTGIGAIFGYENTQFAIWWDAAESKWLLGLDGQPFWYSSDNTDIPNSTLLSGNWIQIDDSEGLCDVVIQGTGTHMPITTNTLSSENTLTQIYSNKSVIYVHLAQAAKASITVFDVSGHKVKEFNSLTKTIQINDLRKGVYIINVSSVKASKSKKVIVL